MVNKLKEGKFATNSSRQKVVAVAIVIVLIILVWQIMAIFSDSKPTTPTPKPAPVSTSVNKMSAMGPSPTGTEVTVTEVTELPQGKVVNDPAFIKMQKATEEKYVVKLNELEELRIQRQIAEMNQGIAAAKLATVAAEKDISELLTRPSQPSQPYQPIPEAVYTSQLVNGVNPAESPIPPPPITNPIADYTVISVSMQLHKWSAVLGYQGKLITVNIGDSLPDNSTVVSINKNNVVLKKDGETKKIAIVSSI